MDENIQKRIKSYLKRNGITQQELADKLGISQPAVASLLNGRTKFTIKNAMVLERVLGINSTWLITGEGDMLLGNVTGNVEQHDQSQFAQGDINNTLSDAMAIIKKQQEQIDELINLLKQKNNE